PSFLCWAACFLSTSTNTWWTLAASSARSFAFLASRFICSACRLRRSARSPVKSPVSGAGRPSRRRIGRTTFGSLGDLHPYIAVALGLKARGHEAVIATSGYYRQKVEALGIGFRSVRPDHTDPEAEPELMRRVMDRRTGSEFVIRE